MLPSDRWQHAGMGGAMRGVQADAGKVRGIADDGNHEAEAGRLAPGAQGGQQRVTDALAAAVRRHVDRDPDGEPVGRARG
jgi:hypothetical protein